MARIVHSFPINQRAGNVEDFVEYASNVVQMFESINGLERVGPPPPWGEITELPQSAGVVNVSYRLVDQLSDQAPVYLQLSFYDAESIGSRASAGCRLIVSTGIDVDFNPVDRVFTTGNITSGNRLDSQYNIDSFPSFLCVTEGFIGFHFGQGRLSSWVGGFTIRRYHDDLGYPTPEGLIVHYRDTMFSYRYMGGSVHPAVGGNTFCTLVSNTNSSAYEDRTQVYKHFIATPEVRPDPCVLTVQINEIPAGAQFEAAVSGGRVRNFISTGSSGFGPSNTSGNSNYGCAFIWE